MLYKTAANAEFHYVFYDLYLWSDLLIQMNRKVYPNFRPVLYILQSLCWIDWAVVQSGRVGSGRVCCSSLAGELRLNGRGLVSVSRGAGLSKVHFHCKTIRGSLASLSSLVRITSLYKIYTYKKKWRIRIRWNPPLPLWTWTTRRWLCRPSISTGQANNASWNKCKPSGEANPGAPATGADPLLYLRQVRAADPAGPHKQIDD